MTDSTEKIIELIKNTGDRRVILDSKGRPVYVLMAFTDYQNLVNNNDGAEKQVITDKVNEDVANWRESEKKNDPWSVFGQSNTLDYEKKSLNQAKKDLEKNDSDQRYYFEPID